jgi:phage protein D
VNRAKLKFTNINTTTSRVSVSNKETSPRERAQNKSQANEQVRHGDLFYRGSVLANLLPVEEATKAGSLSTLPSLKRSTDRVSFLFSNHLEHKVPTRTTTGLVSLASITSEFDCKEWIKKEESNPSARARKNTSKSLSLVTMALCGDWRGFDLFGVSRIEC